MTPAKKYQNLVKLFLEVEPARTLTLENFVFDAAKEKTPADFIYNFLTGYSKNYKTIDSDGKFVTGTGFRRSLTETFLIACSYFPDYQLKNYFVDFYEVIVRTTQVYDLVWLIKCPTLKKPVYYFATSTFYQKEFLPVHDLFPYAVFDYRTGREGSDFSSEIYSLLYDRKIVEFLVGDKYKVAAAMTV